MDFSISRKMLRLTSAGKREKMAPLPKEKLCPTGDEKDDDTATMGSWSRISADD
jgi:hypothetical protein